jgi:hypothetical protein
LSDQSPDCTVSAGVAGGQQVLRVNKEKLESDQEVVEVASGGEEDHNVSVVVGCGYPFRERPDGIATVKVVQVPFRARDRVIPLL